jgi:hypothetical protein
MAVRANFSEKRNLFAAARTEHWLPLPADYLHLQECSPACVIKPSNQTICERGSCKTHARNRKLKPAMTIVAQTRFSRLTPRERDALYAYLKARAERS